MKRDPIYLETETLHTLNDPTSGGPNLWQIGVDLSPFNENTAGKYICETKIGNKSVQSRELYLNVQGDYWFQFCTATCTVYYG